MALSLFARSAAHTLLVRSLVPRTHTRRFMDVNIPSETSADGTLRVTARETYDAAADLRPTGVARSPLDQFRAWFTAAQHGGAVREPEAMALATASGAGVPSVRFVLLKELDARGFVFFTNYGSRKSAELMDTPHAALSFYWRETHQSVRVVGRIERVSHEESAAYFRTRPVGSRLGAWASRQSTVVQDGEVQQRLEGVKARFGVTGDEKDADIPVPNFWGGWRVVPECVHGLVLSYTRVDVLPARSSSGRESHRGCMIASAIYAKQEGPTTTLNGRSRDSRRDRIRMPMRLFWRKRGEQADRQLPPPRIVATAREVRLCILACVPKEGLMQTRWLVIIAYELSKAAHPVLLCSSVEKEKAMYRKKKPPGVGLWWTCASIDSKGKPAHIHPWWSRIQPYALVLLRGPCRLLAVKPLAICVHKVARGTRIYSERD
jgi:pyridoxamine-phosphate oxidase